MASYRGSENILLISSSSRVKERELDELAGEAVKSGRDNTGVAHAPEVGTSRGMGGPVLNGLGSKQRLNSRISAFDIREFMMLVLDVEKKLK